MPPPLLVLGADLSTDSIKYSVYDAIDGSEVASGEFDFVEHFGIMYGLTAGGFLEFPGKVVRIPYGLLTDANQ